MVLLDFLFPRRCHICDDELSEGEKYVCGECRFRMTRTMFHTVPLNPMEEKLLGGPKFVRATSQFYYVHDSGAAKLIYDFKYHRYPGLALEMGEMMGRELYPTGFFSDVDVLQPIAMPLFRKASRGYNQSELLARGVSVSTGIPVCDNLRTTRRHATQTRKDARSREENMQGYFRSIADHELEGKGVMLIDDVCTTGATLRSAAKAIEHIPGVRIYYLTLACV